jgi:hypothetical protein
MIKAYYDKKKGLLTFQDDAGYPIVFQHKGKSYKFKQLPVRSGQAGYLNAPWVRSRGAIPYNAQVKTGELYIHLKPVEDPRGDFNNNGIGLFFPISDSVEQRKTIKGYEVREVRFDMGLHPENKWVGSAGCIVLVWNTKERKEAVDALLEWLQLQGKLIKFIELEVL